jgi:hypothetical protein
MAPRPANQMRLRHGTCRELEDAADELLRLSLQGVTSREAKSDILTPWKLEDRYNHEVYTAAGVADPAVRRGIYGRAWNPKYPHLNSRDGHYPVRPAQNGMDTFVADGGGGHDDD